MSNVFVVWFSSEPPLPTRGDDSDLVNDDNTDSSDGDVDDVNGAASSYSSSDSNGVGVVDIRSMEGYRADFVTVDGFIVRHCLPL
jgi:hypothetical protein